jgi:hypothetical protein
MLMNLLPGLRELRAPLASGYLWLLSAWLFLGRMQWLPTERPPGNGEVARLWDLGGTLGRTVVIAAVTFIAYLIGSFLEMDPDGELAAKLKPIVLADRRPAYLVGRDNILVLISKAAELVDRIDFDSRQATAISRSISSQARTDLFDVLYREKMLPKVEDPDRPVVEGQRYSVRDMKEWQRRVDQAELEQLANEIKADNIIYSIVQEMPQLASRLLVKNKDLYGKYDRLMAEASVRMNVSIPLTIMLGLAIWLSNLPLWIQLVLSVSALGFGYMLLRQGFLRAISARDVIVQALVISELESRYLPAKPPTEGSTGRAAARSLPRRSVRRRKPRLKAGSQ